VDPKDRPELVERFQASDLRVLAMTIKTGGEAIDLFASDTAIFLERDWVPANNKQALGRLVRQGQKNKVREVIIEAADTIDTGRLADANRTKQMITSAILGSD
jgi:SNF2 family DNA or RNA helicase